MSRTDIDVTKLNEAVREEALQVQAAVDEVRKVIVGQEEVREDRALARHELPGLLLVDERPHEVGGEEIGRELDARELQVEHLAEGLDRHRLGEAGHALDQEVPPAQQRHHHALHQVALADDDLAHLGHGGLDLERLLAHGLVQPRDVHLRLSHRLVASPATSDARPRPAAGLPARVDIR